MNIKSQFSLIFSVISLSIIAHSSSAQLNMELLSTVEYDVEGNDVWGYVAPDGSEYAIMGTFDGVSIVDVTLPTDPQEVFFIPQQESTWRDMKTWNDHAYVVADEGGTSDGILVIDFTGLPEITYRNINPLVPGEEEIYHCHNIYIDEFGIAYLAGCNGESGWINGGGVLLYDVGTDEGNPNFVGKAAAEYSHDVYARNKVLYSSEIFRGTFTLYDVSDVNNITEMGSQSTPFEFTHNTWLSDDGNIIFTTDEKPNAPVAAYDISDPSDMKFLDQFRPRATLNTGVIPHNVHVWNDFLIISYYTDGCILVDASRPDNLIEVGNLDTYFGTDIGNGFLGNWGAYPFFPSGNIILGDIGNAMHVVGPTYVRACHLEGVITSKDTGDPVLNAHITSTQIDIEEYSNLTGTYKTGTAIAGTYEVTVSALGYVTETRTVELENGVVAIEDFQLESQKRITLRGLVKDAETGETLEGAKINTVVNGTLRQLTSDAAGGFSLFQVFAGEYDFIVGQWGYKTEFVDAAFFDGEDPMPTIEILLDRGYEDIFSLDLGWQSDFDGDRGQWFRAAPIGIRHPALNLLVTPEADSDNDAGIRAYVTGQSTDLGLGKLIGTATLTSPTFNVSDMEEPVILFDYWLWATTPSLNVTTDAIEIYLTDGQDTVLVESLTMETLDEVLWKTSEPLSISDHFPLDSELQVIFEVHNNDLNDLVDAGLDFFRIVELRSVAVEEPELKESYVLYPNPGPVGFRISTESGLDSEGEGRLSLYSLQGELLETFKIENGVSAQPYGVELSAGIYLVSWYQSGALKFLKTWVKTE